MTGLLLLANEMRPDSVLCSGSIQPRTRLAISYVHLGLEVAGIPSVQRPAFGQEKLQGHRCGPPSRISVMFPFEQGAER